MKSIPFMVFICAIATLWVAYYMVRTAKKDNSKARKTRKYGKK